MTEVCTFYHLYTFYSTSTSGSLYILDINPLPDILYDLQVRSPIW